MRLLSQGIEVEQPARGLNGGLDGTRVHLLIGQTGQRSYRQLREPLSLASEPLLEGLLREREAVEQLATVERGRARNGGHRSLSEQALEGHHVDLHDRAVQRD